MKLYGKNYSEEDFQYIPDCDMEYKKFDMKELKQGDVFYKLDLYSDVPPLKLVATAWCEKNFNEGERYSTFRQFYPKSIMVEWKEKYGSTKREWKKFLQGLNNRKEAWVFFDEIYVGE